MAPDTAEKVGKATPPTFQDVIMNLQRYWASTGCVVLQPYDNEVGAGTNAPATTLRSLGPDTWRTCYVQGCRRPTDGRYGENPNRGQFYYQFQVLIKPSPDNIQDLYLGSLEAIGIDISAHDVRFVEDDWESPTLGAWGLGWEIWIDGMEVTQFTYFQQVGGFECDPVPVEIAYGLERLTMFVQGVDNMYDIVWARGDDGVVFTYGDVYLENEREYSAFNFEVADTEFLFQEFADREVECLRTLKASLPLPAYDSVLKCCHAFNLLDARGVISATERMAYILRVRTLAKACCASYMKNVVGMDVDTSDLDALLADVPDPLAKPAVEEAADVRLWRRVPRRRGRCGRSLRARLRVRDHRRGRRLRPVRVVRSVREGGLEDVRYRNPRLRDRHRGDSRLRFEARYRAAGRARARGPGCRAHPPRGGGHLHEPAAPHRHRGRRGRPNRGFGRGLPRARRQDRLR